MNSREIIAAATFWIMGCAVSAAADTSPVQLTDEGLRATFSEILDSVSAPWNVKAALDISEDGSVISRPDGHIEVGKLTLIERLNSVEPNYRPLALRFIMLHELWHQVQFRDQGSDIESDSDLGRFLECQADIMAS